MFVTANLTKARGVMMRFGATLLLLLGVLCRVSPAGAAGTDREAVILARVLSYDRNLKTRAGESVTIAVLSGNSAAARAEAEQTLRDFRPLEKLKIAGLPIHVIRLEYRSSGQLQNELLQNGVDTLYLGPGLDQALEEIKLITYSRRILSIGSKIEHVQRGAAVGAFLEDGAFKIHVNLAASREEGAAFTSDLLALARVIR